MSDVVAFFMTSNRPAAGRLTVEERQTQLEAFAQHNELTVVRSLSGPIPGTSFEQAVALSRDLGGLLLVTNDSTDDQDLRLMVNLTRQGVRFLAVNVSKSVWPKPTDGEGPKH